jgi:SP family arabinose:H+ symporter-like MFS transporter
VAALGGLLFGYDTAVIAGTVEFLQKRFNLSDLELGWTVSSALIGCVADRGRNGTLVCPAPPSEPDWRISRIRLSS